MPKRSDRPTPAGRPRPYRGSTIVPVRVPDELLAIVDALVATSTTTRVAGGYTRSSFVIKAIEEKIKKMARSAKSDHRIPESYSRDQYHS